MLHHCRTESNRMNGIFIWKLLGVHCALATGTEWWLGEWENVCTTIPFIDKTKKNGIRKKSIFALCIYRRINTHAMLSNGKDIERMRRKKEKKEKNCRQPNKYEFDGNILASQHLRNEWQNEIPNRKTRAVSFNDNEWNNISSSSSFSAVSVRVLSSLHDRCVLWAFNTFSLWASGCIYWCMQRNAFVRVRPLVYMRRRKMVSRIGWQVGNEQMKYAKHKFQSCATTISISNGRSDRLRVMIVESTITFHNNISLSFSLCPFSLSVLNSNLDYTAHKSSHYHASAGAKCHSDVG